MKKKKSAGLSSAGMIGTVLAKTGKGFSDVKEYVTGKAKTAGDKVVDVSKTINGEKTLEKIEAYRELFSEILIGTNESVDSLKKDNLSIRLELEDVKETKIKIESLTKENATIREEINNVKKIQFILIIAFLVIVAVLVIFIILNR